MCINLGLFASIWNESTFIILYCLHCSQSIQKEHKQFFVTLPITQWPTSTDSMERFASDLYVAVTQHDYLFTMQMHARSKPWYIDHANWSFKSDRGAVNRDLITALRRPWSSFLLPLLDRPLLSSSFFKSTTLRSFKSLPSIDTASSSAIFQACTHRLRLFPWPQMHFFSYNFFVMNKDSDQIKHNCKY